MNLSRIRAGERAAFETLVSDTWDDLVDYLTWILASRDAAEDACQDAFLRLWEQRERWHDGSARALLFRIGRNLAFDAKRRERIRRKWAERETTTPGGWRDAEEQAQISELEHRFREALAALTPARRKTVESVRLHGLTHVEAAEALGVSRQTIANRMTLALADLRLLLRDVLPDATAKGARTARRCRLDSTTAAMEVSTGAA